jgi:carboxyl-terminal processing protease
MKQLIRTIILIFVFGLLYHPATEAQILNEQAFKLFKLIDLISSYYVDTVNESKLTEEAIRQVLKELDPHSVYISRDEVKEMNQPLMGDFEGVGIYFNVLNDTIIVISPISGGPSEKVGLRAGDRIVRIDGENVAGIGITTSAVRKKLMGPAGTKVEVDILRRGVKGLLHFTITRDKIPIFSLDASYMPEKNIGYIKINRFSAKTMDEFHKALDEMPLDHMEGLILDLRGNGGGVLTAATDLVDEFMPAEKLIVYMEGSHLKREDFYTTAGGRLQNVRLVVLVDEGTASASEIFSGAVQDWDRGVLIGRRTFGKGLVQKPFYLPDYSMVRLTIARYFTPSGRLIQKSYKGGYDNYMKELDKRYRHGELMNADSIHFPDSLKYYTLTNHRVVYGGGGIMPDIFVPADTAGNTPYLREMIGKGVVTDFTLSWVDEHRKETLKKYPSVDDYIRGFTLPEKDVRHLREMGEKRGVKADDAVFDRSRKQLLLLIRALLARDLWDSTAYFRILNEEAPVFLKALEIVKDPGRYQKVLSGK